VGGVLVPEFGNTYTQKAVALAYKSRIAMGGHCVIAAISSGKQTRSMEVVLSEASFRGRDV